MKKKNELGTAELEAIEKSIAEHRRVAELSLAKKKPTTAREDIKYYSAWEFVGCAVLKALKGQPPRTASGNQLVAVLVAAICPAALAESNKSPNTGELARVYLGFYAKQPELVLRLLGVIRKKWNCPSKMAKLQKHILTHAWHQKPSTNQNGILQQDATDAETILEVFGRGARGDGKKERQRIKLPSWQPNISFELNAALLELREAGFDIGWGV